MCLSGSYLVFLERHFLWLEGLWSWEGSKQLFLLSLMEWVKQLGRNLSSAGMGPGGGSCTCHEPAAGRGRKLIAYKEGKKTSSLFSFLTFVVKGVMSWGWKKLGTCPTIPPQCSPSLSHSFAAPDGFWERCWWG